jgi:hypothetical protein
MILVAIAYDSTMQTAVPITLTIRRAALELSRMRSLSF